MSEIFNNIIEYIKTPEFLTIVPVIGAFLAELGVGIGLNVRSNRNTNVTKDTINELKETVEDKKLQRQMKVVLKENAELKKVLTECMETITKIKKD